MYCGWIINKIKKKPMAPTILERGLPICGLSLTMYVSKSMTFPTPHMGHSRHGSFFTRLDCQSNGKPSHKDHDLLGTFGVAVSIPNHYTIWVVKIISNRKQLINTVGSHLSSFKKIGWAAAFFS
jgi:hypothetical protein